jgi:prepilin-type N-terminal cleavage/methylation domain-containing protein
MRSRSRAGFTLIELMVSMVLTLVIMTILAQAFVMALNTFSGLKGLGDMQQALRTAAVILRGDLQCAHLEGDRKLNDPNLTNGINFPVNGFVVVKQGTAVSTKAGSLYFNEGTDSNNMVSYRAVNHLLYLTCRRSGNRPESYFTTKLQGPAEAAPPASATTFLTNSTAYNLTGAQLSTVTLADAGYYKSQWAEVAYFLSLNDESAWAIPLDPKTGATTNAPTKTYSLYRVQFLMTPSNTSETKIKSDPAFWSLACNPGAGNVLTFYTPETAAQSQLAQTKLTPPNQQRTINPTALTLPVTPSPAPQDPQWTRLTETATLVLPNVISFQVQIMQATGTTFIDVPTNGTSGRLFDTSLLAPPPSTTPPPTYPTKNTYPTKYGLKAIQITLRVWDTTTRQTRQVTVMQEL